MADKKGLLFDTHSHYDDEKFDYDRDAVLMSLEGNGVGYAVDVGCSFSSIPKAMSLAEKYEFMYFTAGLHPCDVLDAEKNGENETLDYLRSVLSHEKAVALGEIGLDYHWDDVPRDIQKKWFRMQLELAEEIDIPVVIHDREAHGDTMDILREYKNVKGIFHCFGGSPEMAAELIKNGWYISFSGVLTFKNAARLPEVAKIVPNDRMLLETDCPYLAPQPFRGKRNDSALMRYTAMRLAEIRGMTYDEVVKITEDNAFCVYRLK